MGVVYTRSHVKLGLTTSDENWFSEFVVIQYLILAVMAVYPYKATCREFRVSSSNIIKIHRSMV